jgi:ATP-binding cassette subfamily B (MDR/TAP) protein 1
VVIQDTISAKMGHLFLYIAQFIAIFAVGFSSIWKLTLLIVVVVPLMSIAGDAYVVSMIGLLKKQAQIAYSETGKVLEEAIS